MKNPFRAGKKITIESRRIYSEKGALKKCELAIPGLFDKVY